MFVKKRENLVSHITNKKAWYLLWVLISINMSFLNSIANASQELFEGRMQHTSSCRLVCSSNSLSAILGLQNILSEYKPVTIVSAYLERLPSIVKRKLFREKIHWKVFFLSTSWCHCACSPQTKLFPILFLSQLKYNLNYSSTLTLKLLYTPTTTTYHIPPTTGTQQQLIPASQKST